MQYRGRQPTQRFRLGIGRQFALCDGMAKARDERVIDVAQRLAEELAHLGFLPPGRRPHAIGEEMALCSAA